MFLAIKFYLFGVALQKLFWTDVIDPYESGAFDGAIGYAPITHHADIVLVSHHYGDHNLRARSKARSAKSMKRAPMI